MTLVQSRCNFSLISRFCIISIFQNELAEFKREFGHCNVPRSYKRNPQLGRWCDTQRQLLKNGKLSQDRIDKLYELGFTWVLKEHVDWNVRYVSRSLCCSTTVLSQLIFTLSFYLSEWACGIQKRVWALQCTSVLRAKPTSRQLVHQPKATL